MGKRSRKRPYGDGHIPLNIDRATGGVRRETGPGGRIFQVRSIPSGAKEYRCPGCQQIIRIGTPHVVAWTEDTPCGAPRSASRTDGIGIVPAGGREILGDTFSD